MWEDLTTHTKVMLKTHERRRGDGEVSAADLGLPERESS